MLNFFPMLNVASAALVSVCYSTARVEVVDPRLECGIVPRTMPFQPVRPAY
jgi:hypothetical protein